MPSNTPEPQPPDGAAGMHPSVSVPTVAERARCTTSEQDLVLDLLAANARAALAGASDESRWTKEDAIGLIDGLIRGLRSPNNAEFMNRLSSEAARYHVDRFIPFEVPQP